VSQIVANAELAKQLQEATGPVYIVTDQGTMIGQFTPMKFPRSPYSREEIERSRQQARESGGKPLKEILARLQAEN